MAEVTLENVQANLPLVEPERGTPTAYFEDWLFKVVEDLNTITGATVASASNVGAGAEVFDQQVATDLQFRTLISSDASVGISQGVEEIDLTISGAIADGTVANSILTWSGSAWTEFQELLLSHSAGALTMQVEDSLGVDQIVMLADADDVLSLYHDGTATLRTAAVAAGGAEANNTLTAAGWERVLTVSDVPFTAWTTLYGDGSAVPQALALGASGEVLTSNGASAAPSWQAGGGGGLTQFQDNGLFGEGLYDTFVAFSTDTLGILVNGVNADTQPRINFLDAPGGNQVGNIRATGSGFVVDNRITSGITIIRAKDSGGSVVNLVSGDPDAELDLYHNAGLAARTALLGMDLADSAATGITALQFFDQNYAAQHGVLLTNHSSTGIRLRSNIHAATVVLDGEDTGGTAVNLLVGDPDGAVELYYDATSIVETDTQGIKIKHASPWVHLNDAAGTTVLSQYTVSGNDVYFDNNIVGGDFIWRASNVGAADAIAMTYDESETAMHLYFDDAKVFATAVDGIEVHSATGPNIQLMEASVLAGIWQIFTDGNMYQDNRTLLGDSIHRLSELGAADQIVWKGNNAGSFDAYYDGNLVFETTSQGIQLTAITATAGVMQISADVGQVTAINFEEAANTKYQVAWNAGSNEGYIRMTDTGDDFRIYNLVDGDMFIGLGGAEVQLYHNGLLAFETGINGAAIRDANNNTDVVMTLKSNGGTGVSRLYSDVGVAFYIDQLENGLPLKIRADDAGGTAQTMIEVDGDTGVAFNGGTPTAPVTYTRTATVVESRTLAASASASATNNNNVLAALIADLQTIGILA